MAGMTKFSIAQIDRMAIEVKASQLSYRDICPIIFSGTPKCPYKHQDTDINTYQAAFYTQ